jgi:hypothetical protein
MHYFEKNAWNEHVIGLDSRWDHRFFSIYLMVLGLTQSLTNEYQESSWGCKPRPARKADNLTVIFEPTV